MATSIARLSVSLTARTKGFRKGMRSASKSLKTFSRSVISVTGKLAKFGGAMAALATGGTILMVRSSFKSIDALGKMSDRVGIATEKLGSLQFAATQTGSSLEGMNKGLSFLAKTLGEAKQGIGEGKQALEALGLTVDDFLGKAPDEHVRLIADSFEGLATQEEKAFIAAKLFGRGGLELINLLDQGRAGIDRLEATFVSLGGGFSKLSTVLIAQSNDAISRMQTAFRIGSGNIAITMAPFVTAATNAFTTATVAGNQYRDAMIGNASDVAKAFDIGLTTIRLMRLELRNIAREAVGTAAGGVAGVEALFRGVGGAAMGLIGGGGASGMVSAMRAAISTGTVGRAAMGAVGPRIDIEAERASIEQRHGGIDIRISKIVADAASRLAFEMFLKRPPGVGAFQALPSLAGIGIGAAKSRAAQFREISVDRVALEGRGGPNVQNNILTQLKTAVQIAKDQLQLWKQGVTFPPGRTV